MWSFTLRHPLFAFLMPVSFNPQITRVHFKWIRKGNQDETKEEEQPQGGDSKSYSMGGFQRSKVRGEAFRQFNFHIPEALRSLLFRLSHNHSLTLRSGNPNGTSTKGIIQQTGLWDSITPPANAQTQWQQLKPAQVIALPLPCDCPAR